MAPPHITRLVAVGGINADTPLGMVQIGGGNTLLSATLFFQMICDLQAKVAILTERSKNMGVILTALPLPQRPSLPYGLHRQTQKYPFGPSTRQTTVALRSGSRSSINLRASV